MIINEVYKKMENLMRIKAESRTEVGKKFAKNLRKEGKIPAVIYGENQDSIVISLLRNDVRAILKTESGVNTILKIQKDDTEVDAMLKEVQLDYLSDNIIHADFIRIDLNKPVIVNVPVVVEGEPIGVKLEDGFFDFVTREVKVKCLPTRVPKEFVIEVSGMHTGSSIKAENLTLGDDVKLVTDSHKVICAVTSKRMEETPAEAAAAVTEAAATPEGTAKPETKAPEPAKDSKDKK